MADNRTIQCPKCGEAISLDSALTHHIETDLKRQYEEKLTNEKANLWKIAQEKAAEKIKAQSDLQLKQLQEDLLEERKKRENAQQSELEVRKLKNKLEEEKQNFELEKQRQLDIERNKIREDVGKILSSQHQLKDAEKDKIINDLKKSLEDAQRKAQQGSQQLQGEVMELELETMLKNEFPYDEIIPVGKGIQGADIIHKVHDRSGRIAGTITWESKRTKAWSDSWVQKLKDDQREARAEIAILITNVLPTDVKNFGPKNGIYVCNYESILGVAHFLRSSLLQVTSAKESTIGKNEKMEVLWNYLTSTEFKQRMEALVEAFTMMKLELEKEKRVYTKLWTKREKQIQKMMDSTVGLRGELEGVMGNALPAMKELELEDLLEDESEQLQMD